MSAESIALLASRFVYFSNMYYMNWEKCVTLYSRHCFPHSSNNIASLPLGNYNMDYIYNESF